MKIPFPRFTIASLLAVLLCGCAVQVKHTPAQLQGLSAGRPAERRVLSQALEVRLDTGYIRMLKAGTEWQAVGSLPQGTVHRAFNDVFTLEGAHVHEAYLVVQGEQLVGFYLPAERGFSRLNQPQPIHFQ
jgi:hypothetical protein